MYVPATPPRYPSATAENVMVSGYRVGIYGWLPWQRKRGYGYQDCEVSGRKKTGIILMFLRVEQLF